MKLHNYHFNLRTRFYLSSAFHPSNEKKNTNRWQTIPLSFQLQKGKFYKIRISRGCRGDVFWEVARFQTCFEYVIVLASNTFIRFAELVWCARETLSESANLGPNLLCLFVGSIATRQDQSSAEKHLDPKQLRN